MYFTPFSTQCTALSYQIGFVHLQTFFVSTVEEISPQWEEQKLCALWQTLWRTAVLSFFGVCARTYNADTYLSFSLPKCTRTQMVRTDEGIASNEVTAQENKEFLEFLDAITKPHTHNQLIGAAERSWHTWAPTRTAPRHPPKKYSTHES